MEYETDLTIGCDPELFVGYKGSPEIVSAHGLIPGTKENPEPSTNGALQVDGMALEFNILPAKDLKSWLNNIKVTMFDLESRIRHINPNFEFRIQPVARFSKEYMTQVPEEAKILGCTPDFNAYTGKENPMPDAATLMRTASGHIHVGWTYDQDFAPGSTHFNDCANVVKQLDASMYLVSILWDRDTERRKLYGAMGAFRPKAYGVEYRVLSNAWLKSTQMQAWIYMATCRAMELLAEGRCLWKDDSLRILGPTLAHKKLVLEYGFPSLPSYKVK